jgi:Terminase large subunit, T4likevirus-type, N-terminal
MIVSLTSAQSAVFSSNSRFRALAAGRRSGKTYLACVELIRAAWGPKRVAWYVAPTYKQAKRIAWKQLKQLTRPFWASPPNETDLRIELLAGGTIALRGADNYDSLRGEGLDFVVLDEFASMHPAVFPEVIRPALSDRMGKLLFIGTPRGRNHFYDVFQDASEQADWAAFQYTTEQGGLVSVAELAQAARELDERTFRTEYQASFENLGVGTAYFAFDRSRNVRRLRYDPKLPLFWALDFNVNPLCSVLGQTDGTEVHVLDELVLPNSNTLAACEEFLSRTRSWATVPEPFSEPLRADMRDAYDEILGQLQPAPINVYLYGDATGEQRRTSASRTDWQIVRNFFGRHTDRYHASSQVPSSNPMVKDRINCLNAVLRSHSGEHRLLIDPKCKQLIKDFEQVCWKADSNGNPLAELDKSDPMRTHATDALGYFIARQFPMRAQNGERGGPSIV